MTVPTQKMKGRRGQVLVLACVTMLTMALMLMLSFSVGNAVHERIRLQSYADSQAYSAAVIEARALNGIAYNNRAIAAALVAQMGHHARWSVAKSSVDMFLAAAMALGVVGAMEFASCSIWQPQHCIHGIKAFISAVKFFKEWKNWDSKLDGKKQAWEQAVGSLQEMISVLHDDQSQLAQWAGQNASNGSSEILKNAKYWGAQHAEPANGVLSMNRQNFDKVFEENPDDKIMASVAMATRPRYEHGSYNGIHTANKGFTMKNISDKCGTTFCPPMIRNPTNITDVDDGLDYNYFLGQTEADVGGGNNTNNVEGRTGLRILLATTKNNPYDRGPGFGVVPAASARSNRGQNGYQGTPCGGEACFSNYAGGDGNDVQPVTYGGVKQDIRKRYTSESGDYDGNEGADEHGVWATRKEGGDATMRASIGSVEWKIAVDGTDGKTGGVAVAKGKVYYHQLGRWEQPPNLFDPFWRAKLHPFESRDELNNVLSAAGDSVGPGLQTPVEGGP